MWRFYPVKRRMTVSVISLAVTILFCFHFLNSVTYIYSLDWTTAIRDMKEKCGVQLLYRTPLQAAVSYNTAGEYKEYVHRTLRNIEPTKDLLYGHFRDRKGFLTIGIPSVIRPGKDYVVQTLKSLAKHSTSQDKQNIVVVLFLVDQNVTLVQERAKLIYETFPNLVQSGFLQIVHPHNIKYPDFSKLKRNFNDSLDRVTWRSKQNLDYAYLLMYSRNMSRYYLQLEDDVTAARNYPLEIDRYIQNNSQSHWYVLEFSTLGFIGKLFRSTDLKEFAVFLTTFFDEQPGDLLLRYMQKIKTQFQDFARRPSLFQHEGELSSLKGKFQWEKDWNFHGAASSARKKYLSRINNPSASLYTSMRLFEDHNVIRAFDDSDRFMWAMNPRQGDKYTIVLTQPTNVTRIYIKTGHIIRKTDALDNGCVYIAQSSYANPCGQFHMYGNFIRGKYDTKLQNITLPINVRCIEILVTQHHDHWLIIREIALFVGQYFSNKSNEDDESD